MRMRRVLAMVWIPAFLALLAGILAPWSGLGASPGFAQLPDFDGDGLADSDEIDTYLTNPLNPDTDFDGCLDGAEVAPKANAQQGGGRNARDFWDFYDVWTRPGGDPSGWERNGSVDLFGDIFGVAYRFGANDSGPGTYDRNSDPLSLPNPATSDPREDYHPAFDRAEQIGPNVWNIGPPDGSIDLFTDIFGVAFQFGHTCPSPISLPPDPSDEAPPLDRTVATDVATATEFLYTGEDPIQTGVAPGTIEAERAAVLRGQVMTRGGGPLSGVLISILGHPEFGSTLSRADGAFDMAVNGGGVLTVRYEKLGFLPAQRQIDVPWQDYARLPDVVLVPYDDEATIIDLSAPLQMQVARGNLEQDDDGQRQTTLLFPQGTQAEVVFSDGSTQPITTLSVRITEYTVGTSGPAAMPAELPPSSGYTYAVEFTVDEAILAGAEQVRFSEPVIHYVENFLGFPVGGIVPVGFYDTDEAGWIPQPAWVPGENGLVVEVLAINGGLAELDVDGTGQAADPAALAALGITNAERQQLAALYAPGQSLWRVPTPHFSGCDCNWPVGPPPDAVAPGGPEPTSDDPVDDPCEQSGSIIECQNQVLGEAYGITGTPYRLHYGSDRVEGRLGARYLQIPLSGASVPASLKRIDLEVGVAGRTFSQSFPPLPDQEYTFPWDGEDAYGRTLQGRHPVSTRIGYVYDGVFQVPAPVPQSFARLSGAALGIPARQEVILWKETQGTIDASGSWDALAQGLGGWTLNVHHAYDPGGRVLHLGDGDRRSAQSFNQVIGTVAGTGVKGMGGDNGPASEAKLSFPADVVVGPDGSLYIADPGNHRIRRVGRDGVITTVAGTGTPGSGGDNGEATQAQLNFPVGVDVGPDGSLYIADEASHRVRRVGPKGIITTVAGTGVPGYGGDEGDATGAQLNLPQDVAVAADRTLYIADAGNHRIRRIGPDGIISTVAGIGAAGYGGDEGPVGQAQLNFPTGVALGPDGSLYIADTSNQRVRRLGPDGIIRTVAGTGVQGDGGDGGPGNQAQLRTPSGVAVSSDGTTYIADAGNHRVRMLESDGTIVTVAGTGIGGFSGEDGPAAQAELNLPVGVTVAPDGAIHIAGPLNNRVRRVEPPLPGFSSSDFAIPSEDGSLVYVFDNKGRHLRTVNAFTAATVLTFTYDGAGQLTTVQDGDSNVTTVERNVLGQPVAIVAPFGQRTEITLDPNGYVETISNPANETTTFAYSADGLLGTLTDPNGGAYQFTYDGLGRLSRYEDPATGSLDLVRSATQDGYVVSTTTAEGRIFTYAVERTAAGGQRFVSTEPSGAQTEVIIGADGEEQINYPDGRVETIVHGPDPRFGMQSPVLTALTVTTPGGITSTLTGDRVVTLAGPGDPLSLETLTETVTINGRTHTVLFDASTRQVTSTTPEGRQTVTTIDALGRVLASQKDPGLSVPLQPTTFAYDTSGRLEHTSQGTLEWNLTYDAKGRIQTRSDAAGVDRTYSYSASDRIESLGLRSGDTFGFVYDDNGNPTTLVVPSMSEHQLQYTGVDVQQGYTPPGNGPYLTTYNSDRDATAFVMPSGRTLSVAYDIGGRQIELAYPEATVTFSYNDATSRLSSMSRTPAGGGVDQQVGLSYDGELVVDTAWSGVANGGYAFRYDQDLRLVGRTFHGDVETQLAWDDDSLLTGLGPFTFIRNGPDRRPSQLKGGDVDVTFSYDDLGRLESRTDSVNGQQVYHIDLTYDSLGRIDLKTEIVAGASHILDYSYQADGELDEVQLDGTPAEAYTYDPNGNRLSRRRGTNPPEVASYDQQDRLIQQGSVVYEFDVDGFLVQRDAETFQLSSRGELLTVDLGGGQLIAYTYDGDGRRVARVDGPATHQYFYGNPENPAEITAIRDPSGIVTNYYYDEAGQLFAFQRGAVWYYVSSDHLGTPRVVADTTGAPVKIIERDSFGNVVADSNPAFELPIGFAGGLEDADTGLLRFGLRDYDPVAGRWISRDPIFFGGGQANLYAYVDNDPVNYQDPQGLAAEQACPVGLCEGRFQSCVKAATSWLREENRVIAKARAVALFFLTIPEVISPPGGLILGCALTRTIVGCAIGFALGVAASAISSGHLNRARAFVERAVAVRRADVHQGFLVKVDQCKFLRDACQSAFAGRA